MKKYLLPSISIVCVLIGFLSGNAVSSHAKADPQGWWGANFQQPSKVQQLLDYMSAGYVDELNMDSLTDEVMQDVVQKLDPHSAYIPKKDLEIVNSELGSSFSGIGVQFNIQQDTVCIVAVISGGPSEHVGVLAGDKIVSVDDSVFVGKGINNERVMHTLRGPKDTEVKLGVRRSGVRETLYYTITRGDIPVHSVDAAFMMEVPGSPKKIGYIKVNKFSETTYDEFMAGLAKLRNQGAEAYIVDLKGNSGGYMDQAIKMANEFLQAGDLIVSARGRAYRGMESRATGSGRFRAEELIVLIDDFSASAAEIFAGAMQDNDRAVIVGRRSFGKGLVQQQLPFHDGSAMRLTVARYYTPSGRCIQKPYVLGEQEDYQRELMERFENGEFYSADSIHLKDTTRYYTKSGRVVYGGGGIMPDYFVGRDTTLNTPYYNKCVNLAYTYQFAFQYTDRHRRELSKFTDWQQLENHLLKKDVLSDFVRFADAKGVNAQDTTLTLFSPLSVEQQIAKSTPLLNHLICAYIIRNILGDEGFYPIFEREDEITKKALEILTK